MHFLHMISYYNFRTLKETRKHTSASDTEKPTAQLPFDYKWLSTNSSLIFLRTQDYYVTLSKLPPSCICSHSGCELWAYSHIACDPNIIPEASNDCARSWKTKSIRYKSHTAYNSKSLLFGSLIQLKKKIFSSQEDNIIFKANS